MRRSKVSPPIGGGDLVGAVVINKIIITLAAVVVHKTKAVNNY
jgi:hypothetical protein